MGGPDELTDDNVRGEVEMYKAECEHVMARSHRGSGRVEEDVRDLPDTFGVACSGGGIRSASFSLGALQALKEEGILKKVDFLSTVSGGGYTGTGLLSYIREMEEDTDNIDVALDRLETKFEETPSWITPSKSWYGKAAYSFLFFLTALLVFPINSVVVIALSVPLAELMVFMFRPQFENMCLNDRTLEQTPLDLPNLVCKGTTPTFSSGVKAECLAIGHCESVCDQSPVKCITYLMSMSDNVEKMDLLVMNLLVVTCVAFFLFLVFRIVALHRARLREQPLCGEDKENEEAVGPRKPHFESDPEQLWWAALYSSSWLFFMSLMVCWGCLFAAALVFAFKCSGADEGIGLVVVVLIAFFLFILLLNLISPSADNLMKLLVPACFVIFFEALYVVGKLVNHRMFPCDSSSTFLSDYTWYDISVASTVTIGIFIPLYATATTLVHFWTRANLESAFHNQDNRSCCYRIRHRFAVFCCPRFIREKYIDERRFVDLAGRTDTPVYLCNCTLNDFDRPGLDETRWDMYQFSQYYSGCDRLGFDPASKTSLAEGMSISASAVAVAMGEVNDTKMQEFSMSITRILFRFFSIDMGDWIPRTHNSAVPQYAQWWLVKIFEVIGLACLCLIFADIKKGPDPLYDQGVDGTLIWLPWLCFGLTFLVAFYPVGNFFYHSALVRALHQAFGLYPREYPPPVVYLTDGGHTENMGLYSLLRRRVKTILVVDGEEDADLTCDSFLAVLRFARSRLAYYSNTRCAFIDGTNEDSEGVADFALDDVDTAIDKYRGYLKGMKDSSYTTMGHLHIRVKYTDTSKEPGDTSAVTWGDLYYVKLHKLYTEEGTFEETYKGVSELPDNNCCTVGTPFPFHPTANQAFSADLFHKYRRLAKEVFGPSLAADIAETVLRKAGDDEAASMYSDTPDESSS